MGEVQFKSNEYVNPNNTTTIEIRNFFIFFSRIPIFMTTTHPIYFLMPEKAHIYLLIIK